LVCGANYGRAYLQAIASSPNIHLAGLLTRGSETSRALATSAGLPHYDSVEQVPRDVAIACVAVGAAPGEELALELLSRGLHVLCEHPVRSGFVRLACRKARAAKVVFPINGHFSDIGPVAAFVERFGATDRNVAPAAISAFTHGRLVYSLFDILARGL